MLIVADHVLKLVDKGDWQRILDLGNGVCAAQGGRRVRNDRVEDLGTVEEAPEERIYVSPEKVSANVAGRVALCRGNQPVDPVRHEHEHDVVGVDVGFPPERQRIHYVEAVIDHVAYRIQVRLRQPRLGRGAVHVDRNVAPDLHENGPHGRHAVAFEVAANLERPDRARVGGRECNGGLRLRGRWLRLRGGIRLRRDWVEPNGARPAGEKGGTPHPAWRGGRAVGAFVLCSMKSADSSGVVLAEKGTSTYSICEPVVFVGNTAESPVTRGSTTVHDPTARFSCAPVPVQNGSASVGPSSLHPAATSNDRPIPHKLFDIA